MKKCLSFMLVFGFIMAGVLSVPVTKADAAPSHIGPEMDWQWHGQFRINSYSDFRSDEGRFKDASQVAARLRWRPTVDVKISDTVSLHTQINIGQINSNQWQTAALALRHAVITAALFDSGVTMQAGLVPISDKFGDTLFSGDWDFNPLAFIFTANPGDFAIRAGAGKLVEGDESGNDDVSIYILDTDFNPWGIGASVYYTHGDAGTGNFCGACAGTGNGDFALVNYGLRYSGNFEVFKVNAFALGSYYNNRSPVSSGRDINANGVAGKLEVIVPIQDMTFGVMGVVTSGDGDAQKGGTQQDANFFVTPMSVTGHTGYWGYTGKLNEQGPTDTGIDNHMLNIDGGQPWGAGNLGNGLWTVQGKLNVPVNDIFSAYFAVGGYGATNAHQREGSYYGTDLYAQGKLNLGQSLNLEFGIDQLFVGDGHYNNLRACAGNNCNRDRSITTLFSRLQLEY